MRGGRGVNDASLSSRPSEPTGPRKARPGDRLREREPRPITTVLKMRKRHGVWVGFLAPAKTDPQVIAMLNAAINDTIKNPDVQTKLATIGFDPINGSPAQAETLFKAEVDKWGTMVKALNLQRLSPRRSRCAGSGWFGLPLSSRCHTGEPRHAPGVLPCISENPCDAA
jgi:hypothetical protein